MYFKAELEFTSQKQRS